jgi:hypothetical protein
VASFMVSRSFFNFPLKGKHNQFFFIDLCGFS